MLKINKLTILIILFTYGCSYTPGTTGGLLGGLLGYYGEIAITDHINEQQLINSREKIAKCLKLNIDKIDFQPKIKIGERSLVKINYTINCDDPDLGPFPVIIRIGLVKDNKFVNKPLVSIESKQAGSYFLEKDILDITKDIDNLQKGSYYLYIQIDSGSVDVFVFKESNIIIE